MQNLQVVERAILIADMSGFTIGTYRQGIRPIVEKIFTMRNCAAKIFSEHEGFLYKADADNLFCLFPAPLTALEAAVRLNIELPPHIQICTAIGFGEMVYLAGENDYYGHEVNLTSKLGEDIAGPREILLTAGARAALPPSFHSLFKERRLRIADVDFPYYQLIDLDRLSAGLVTGELR